MDELEVINILKNKLGFSNSSIQKLKKFENYLVTQNEYHNLISKSTVKKIWSRHILDSAQLIKFLDSNKVSKIADFGTGAGFPGLVVAIFNENHGFHVKLYEKSPVKRNFLSNVIKMLKIKNVDIVENVYTKEISAEVVICRAFKKLREIIDISREIVKKPHNIIILKGKNAQKEINNVSLPSNYSYKLENSITDNDSKIIIVDAKK